MGAAGAGAALLGAPPQQDPLGQLLDYLSDKQALLIFDGFEIVLEQASWLASLLRAAPRLTVLVTSRARLEISAEQVFSLGGMPVPALEETANAEQFEAVALFLAFARRRKADFKLDEYTRAGVARLCRLVQGLPLGLLLASAWVELYSPQEIADQIERSLDFLEVTWSDVPERQRSLRATFDYSWDQLTPIEQRDLSALAVFRSSFSLKAAGEVTQAPARVLQSLVDKSMVNRTADGRYQMHDLLHQYAAQKLEEDAEHFGECCTRHSRFYLQALKGWGADLKSPRQRQALEIIDREAENLRAAWRWAVANQDWDGSAAGLEGMAWYADLRFRFEEGECACRTARETIPPFIYPQLVTALTAWQAHFLCQLGQADIAGRLLQAELERLEELQRQDGDVRLEQAQILYELGELSMSADREAAKGYYQHSLALYDERDNERGQALALTSLGEALHHIGPLDQAARYLERGVDLCRRLGDPRLLARALLWLGWNNVRQGELLAGEALIRESIDLNCSIGDRYAEAY